MQLEGVGLGGGKAEADSDPSPMRCRLSLRTGIVEKACIREMGKAWDCSSWPVFAPTAPGPPPSWSSWPRLWGHTFL